MQRILSFVLLALVACSGHTADFALRVDGADGAGHLPSRFSYDKEGCTGKNVTPALHWTDPPPDTRSFAVTVTDPDAPGAHGFTHWFLVDLPAASRGLAEDGSLPQGAYALRNDYGTRGWGGPCPPAGDAPHHYVFTVYALDVSHLQLPAQASPAMPGAAIRDHLLGKAQQTLLFGR